MFGFCLPVSSVSNFRPDTGWSRWSHVQVPLFSRAAGREGRCRQMSPACVGSTCSVPATLGLPRSWRVLSHLHCSGSRLLSRERALRCVRFQFSGPPQKRGLGWACFCAFPAGAAQAARSLMRALSLVRCAFSPPWSQPQFPRAGRVRLVSLLGSWSLAETLPADVNHPESQEVFG